MKRPFCSVVCATYQRSHLLTRSIECYNRSKFPLDRLEVVVVDDGSTDYTQPLMQNFHTSIDVKYVKLRKFGNVWRDCAAVINHGIRIATGEYVLLTHPEVMPGRGSIAWCVEAGTAGDYYSCCKPYYLTQRDQDRLGTVNWINEGPLAVRKIEGFYDDEQHKSGNTAYAPRAVEKSPDWKSWVFGGCRRSVWKSIGGMLESTKWGSVDLLWHMRRHTLGIIDRCGMADDTFVVHQNHDDPAKNVPTPRDLEAAHAEAAAVKMVRDNLVWPAVDNLW